VKWLTRLLPRIYLVSVLQLLAIAGLTIIVGWLTFGSFRPSDYEQRVQYVVDTVSAYLGSPEDVRRELERAKAQMRMQVTLYAQDGGVLASNVQPPLVYTPAPRRRRPPPLPFVAPPERPLMRLPLTSALAPGGYAVVRPPPPREPPSGPGLWALGSALFAIAVASLLLARSLARPISQLRAAAKRFGSGELDARAGLMRHDEFGDLSQAFDEMADRVTQLIRSRQELLADVSHELRTPLARIRVALDLAADGTGDIELQREALSEIAEDCAELERLIADVLQAARLDLTGRPTQVVAQRLHVEEYDPVSLVQRVAERFRTEHPARELVLRCGDGLPALNGDVMLLRRALHNLLDNAQKYSTAPAPIMLSAERVAGELTVRVEDQGIGIAAEDLPRIGSPFFRTDRSRNRRTGGIGLGLSLSRKIVEAHGGSLVVESAPDRGTQVTLRLPVGSAVPLAVGKLHRAPPVSSSP
jgi:two-component system OmpR family sensor kinase